MQNENHRNPWPIRTTAALLGLAGMALSALAADPPEPRVVDPGPVGGPPSDATVLFDGKDLSQWQSANKGGKPAEPGSFTVLFNGVLVQDHVPVKLPTTAAQFSGAVPQGPLVLQDHGNPDRFRNIWIRRLK